MRRENLTILVVGSGAREHALYWAISKSPRAGRVICTPGNGGIDSADRREVKADDIDGIVELARREEADFVVIGPEVPLVGGLADRLNAAGIAAFGPTAQAARLEGSKLFTKELCAAAGIPTARWTFASTYEYAEFAIRTWGSIPVIKADGLCAGKGVVVAHNKQEALEAARSMLVDKAFKDASSRIIIEDRLIGRECSVMAFCDGKHATLLPPARDYKRALDGDTGPNTGGMGAFAPVPDVNDEMLAEIKGRILMPTLRSMNSRGTPFRGLLYAGIMLTEDGPKLLEYNVRFGDPETQAVLPLIRSDILGYLLATLEQGGLAYLGPLDVRPECTVCTNVVSRGYPNAYETGFRIDHLEEASSWAMLFHAGTNRTSEGWFTQGGRVMSCVGVGDVFGTARFESRTAAETLEFGNKFYRKDIAANIGD